MALKAVLFDMDGVIVDTEPLHKKAYYKTFEDLGIEVSDELYASFTGASTKRVCETLIQEFQLKESHEEITAIKRNYFKYLFDHDQDFDLIPGVLSLIKHYHANGVKLVLASSASNNTINWVFDRFGLDPYFVGKISGADLKESKPHPEIFIKAAEIAGEERRSCMVIEDSTNGIIAAHRSEIFCAAYKSAHSKKQDYSLANILVEDYKELELERLSTHF
ncbi:MAG: HAD family phosphatase [Bacteroidetes bacterium]|nr:HAD family phosphatase [Bacteroidota bacterium]